jgi:hypothetical protein
VGRPATNLSPDHLWEFIPEWVVLGTRPRQASSCNKLFMITDRLIDSESARVAKLLTTLERQNSGARPSDQGPSAA